LQAAVDGGYAWLAVVGAFNIMFTGIGYLRVLRIVFIDPPVFEVAAARLDWGIRAAVGLASAGVVFMGLLLGPLHAAATYGVGALLHRACRRVPLSSFSSAGRPISLPRAG